METTHRIHRYPGVKPFESGEKALFFGRDRDIADLCFRLASFPSEVACSFRPSIEQNKNADTATKRARREGRPTAK